MSIFSRFLDIPKQLDFQIEKIRDERRYRKVAKATASLLTRNRAYKNKHLGDECFILANGPSTKSLDLSFLSDYYTIFVNGFQNHKLNFAPDYATLIDPLYVEKSHSKHIQEELDCLRAEETVFWLLHSFREMIPDRESHQYLVFAGDFFSANGLRLDLDAPVSSCNSVGVFSIVLAAYLGFKKAYLVGFDHSWLAYPNLSNVPSVSKGHHDQVDHIESSQWPYEYLARRVSDSFRRYRMLRDHLDIEVINCTEPTLLDVFTKKPLEDVIRNARKKPRVSEQTVT